MRVKKIGRTKTQNTDHVCFSLFCWGSLASSITLTYGGSGKNMFLPTSCCSQYVKPCMSKLLAAQRAAAADVGNVVVNWHVLTAAISGGPASHKIYHQFLLDRIFTYASEMHQIRDFDSFTGCKKQFGDKIPTIENKTVSVWQISHIQ